MACSQNSEENLFTSDNDGDGVSNQQEVVDNTDPNDPCSVRLGSQYSPAISEAWMQLDCDGDGVTNQQELADQTDLFHLCIYNSSSQDTSLTTEEWRLADCDADGVSNGQEIIDGTDEKDQCDFVLESQNPDYVNDFWLALDCDDDGRTNGTEIEGNTNPLDPNNFPGSGDKIVHINNRDIFTNNGSVYDKVVDHVGSTLTDFQYDSSGNLINVLITNHQGNGDYNATYTYNNNLISKVEISHDGTQITYNIVHDGNVMYLFNDSDGLPSGLHSTKYTFNTDGKLILKERFIPDGGIIYVKETFEYNSLGDITDVDRFINQAYNPNTQELVDLPINDHYESHYNFGYLAEVKNPIYNATQRMYINYLLTPEIFSRSWLPSYGAFSQNYRTEYDFFWSSNSFGSGSVFSAHGVHNVQSNQYPTVGYFSNVGTNYDIEFYYEE